MSFPPWDGPEGLLPHQRPEGTSRNRPPEESASNPILDEHRICRLGIGVGEISKPASVPTQGSRERDKRAQGTPRPGTGGPGRSPRAYRPSQIAGGGGRGTTPTAARSAVQHERASFVSA